LTTAKPVGFVDRFSKVATGDRVQHDVTMHTGNAVWLAIGVGVIGLAAAILMFARRHDRPADLGAVSDRWIAEQRAGKMSNGH
jgi:hypothetical protein